VKVVVLAAVLGTLAAGCTGGPVTDHPSPTQTTSSAQITLRMSSRSTLGTTPCIAEARRFGGYSVAPATALCRVGSNREWYDAVITNSGPGAYPACTATAFDQQGNVVFHAPLSFALGGFPAGLFATGHRSIAFDWYLPGKAQGPVSRYMAACAINPNPPT
jgi:hypothetical protein